MGSRVSARETAAFLEGGVKEGLERKAVEWKEEEREM